jgi:hypothetical protein
MKDTSYKSPTPLLPFSELWFSMMVNAMRFNCAMISMTAEASRTVIENSWDQALRLGVQPPK